MLELNVDEFLERVETQRKAPYVNTEDPYGVIDDFIAILSRHTESWITLLAGDRKEVVVTSIFEDGDEVKVLM